MKCAKCSDKRCYSGKDCAGIRSEVEYSQDEIKSMRMSAHLESQYYMKMTRLEELINYAKGMDYRRLGMAFCIGLEREAEIIGGILERDFEVSSVCCKTCGIDKSVYDLERLHGPEGIEAMCNPIGQAMILNKDGTELNVILGLCIGHDALFTKHSMAPVTTLAVKDRVLAHNPLGVIYSGYYLGKKFNIKSP